MCALTSGSARERGRLTRDECKGDMESLGPFLDATPLFLPLTAFAAAASALWLRKRSSTDRFPWLRWISVVCLCGFVALTDTPVGPLSSFGQHGATHVSLRIAFPTASDLTGISSTSLNLFAGLALGAALGARAIEVRRAGPALLAVVLPFLCEFVQFLVPALGRAGFILSDVVVNELGVVIGLAGGAAGAFALIRAAEAQAPKDL